MILSYYYNQQLKKFILGFANIFSGLKVMTGKGSDGTVSTLDVPIVYGSRDRVVSALLASNTQNKQYTLPALSCYMVGLQPAPERQHGVNTVSRKATLEEGGVFPDDVKTLVRVMPIPYTMQMELAIQASSTDQLYQILEQILILFDYDMQVQFNDSPNDWTKITKLILTGLNNEETYPTGLDRRVLMWSLTFDLPIWLSPPVDVRKDIIRTIKIRYGNMTDFSLNEVGPDGEQSPFSEIFATQTIEAPSITLDPADPQGLGS